MRNVDSLSFAVIPRREELLPVEYLEWQKEGYQMSGHGMNTFGRNRQTQSEAWTFVSVLVLLLPRCLCCPSREFVYLTVCTYGHTDFWLWQISTAGLSCVEMCMFFVWLDSLTRHLLQRCQVKNPMREPGDSHDHVCRPRLHWLPTTRLQAKDHKN